MSRDSVERIQPVFESRFRIVRQVGAGYSSMVLEAEDAAGRKVALRVLDGVSSDAFGAGLLGDLVKIADLRHPNLVAVLDSGTEAGRTWIATAWQDAPPLRARLESGPLGVNEAVAALRGLAAALESVHGRGVLHRALRPGQLFLDAAGVRLADTVTGAWIDTHPNVSIAHAGPRPDDFAYLAPEQILGRPPAVTADLFALGCLGYAMLAGAPPAHGGKPMEVAQQQVQARPVPLAERRAETPPALAALVMRLLEKDPGRRPGSAKEVGEALAALG